jgi:hypothetical protein
VLILSKNKSTELQSMTRFSLTRQIPKISFIESAKTAENALIEQYGGPRLYVIFKHHSNIIRFPQNSHQFDLL